MSYISYKNVPFRVLKRTLNLFSKTLAFLKYITYICKLRKNQEHEPEGYS
jgi:hypothetical protein